MKKTTLSILSIVTAVAFTACYNNNFKELHPESALPRQACDTLNTITYQADIKAIFDANCVSCHSGGSQPSLATYQDVISSYSSDALYKSLLTGAVSPMPKGAGPLSVGDIAKIKQWIDGCQPNGPTSGGASLCDTTVAMSYSLNVAPIINANCTNGCHHGNPIDYGHDITTYANIVNDTFNVALSGPPISSLVNCLITTNPSKKMPLGRAALSACQIAKIRRWVAEGALDN
jgi:mono/diheme cytochrome c family protein